jgi:hypothetical protein
MVITYGTGAVIGGGEGAAGCGEVCDNPAPVAPMKMIAAILARSAGRLFMDQSPRLAARLAPNNPSIKAVTHTPMAPITAPMTSMTISQFPTSISSSRLSRPEKL